MTKFDEIGPVDRLLGAGVSEARTTVTYTETRDIVQAWHQEYHGACRTTMLQIMERELRQRGEPRPEVRRDPDDRTAEMFGGAA